MSILTKLLARKGARSQGQLVQLGTLNDTLKGFISLFDVTSNSSTTVAAGTWTKLVTVSSVGFTSNDFLADVNRVTNTKERRVIKVDFVGSYNSGANNVIHTAVFKNGVIVSSSEQDTTIDSGGKSTVIPVQCVTQVTPGDYVEIWVKNQNHSIAIVLRHFNLIVTEL